MHHHRDNGPRQCCVLPFGAEGPELAELRRVTSLQLALWDMPLLVDPAQLAVTELASNVVKHVGEGTPATLVMEVCEDRLRLEMHDTSPTLPIEQQACLFGECGRGLALLAGICDDWGVVHTVSGKSVWCELLTQPTGTVAYDNRRRIERAVTVLKTYSRERDGTKSLLDRRPAVMKETATNLVADLLHWFSDQGCDADDILDRAQSHFEANVLGAKQHGDVWRG